MNRPSLVRVGLYLSMVVAWGFNYLFVEAGLRYAPPLWLAALRAGTGAAGVGLFLYAGPGRAKLDRRRACEAILLGVPNTALFFGPWFWAAESVPPGQAAVVIYTFPLWVALLSIPILLQSLSRSQVAAIGAGFIGIVLVAQPWRSGAGAIAGLDGILLVIAAISWATATVVFKRRFSSAEMQLANGYQIVGGTATLVGAALLTEGWGPSSVGLPLVATVLWLGLVGTAGAYIIFFHLLGKLPAPTLGAYTFLVPVVALAASVALIGESVDPIELVGVGLVLISTYGVSRSGPDRRTAGETRPTPLSAPKADPGRHVK
jgi:probable blue pigment (indigoidine) exporter